MDSSELKHLIRLELSWHDWYTYNRAFSRSLFSFHMTGTPSLSYRHVSIKRARHMTGSLIVRSASIRGLLGRAHLNLYEAVLRAESQNADLRARVRIHHTTLRVCGIIICRPVVEDADTPQARDGRIHAVDMQLESISRRQCERRVIRLDSVAPDDTIDSIQRREMCIDRQ